MSSSGESSADFLAAGRKLFSRPCRFERVAADVDGLPPAGPPEIAFVGRSNVGKSSLVNALTGRRTLARASHTPGRTQQLAFFDLGGVLRLVDTPGYGFAAIAKDQAAAARALTREYLCRRGPLIRVFLLVDGRHGLKDSDEEMMAMLDEAAASYAIVLTKRDEVKEAEAAARRQGVLSRARAHRAAYPEVFFASARTGEGIADLRGHVAEALSGRIGAERRALGARPEKARPD
ncbi:MAG TPA: ribosome biogenesis GTP-binding protein YihA/YsxC [Roseiarcus sp.]|nr:ribosome biogenesis GTP-binding protein YihA/YsxC [Roseiarcus sp.]